MTDAVATRAVREAWLALGRRLFTPPLLALTAGVAILFTLAVQRRAPLPWLILTGAAPAILALMVLGWTATERLEVAWTELKAVRSLPTFWLVCLRGGTEIPLPRAVVTSEALATLRAAAPAGTFSPPSN